MVEPDDTLALNSNTSITSKLGDEEIYFSYKVQKYSRGSIGLFSRNQDRIIMVTDHAFYNLDGAEIKRRVRLEDLYGITVSKLSNQFIIHGGLNEYDFLYISPDKKKLLKLYKVHIKQRKEKIYYFVKNQKGI